MDIFQAGGVEVLLGLLPELILLSNRKVALTEFRKEELSESSSLSLVFACQSSLKEDKRATTNV